MVNHALKILTLSLIVSMYTQTHSMAEKFEEPFGRIGQGFG